MIAVMVELCTSAIIGQQQSISYIWKRRADEAKSECKVYELPRLSYYSPFTYKCHKSNIKNLLMKSSEIVLIFFTCILPDYMAHDIPREFWINIHFENMPAAFLLRCQDLLWQIPPKMMHFQTWKIWFS